MRRRRYTDKDIINALKSSLGIQSAAANILGCDRSTICKAIRERTNIADAHAEILESRIDLAESKLFKAVKNGEPWAIKFLLQSSHGGARGYGNTQQIEFRHAPLESIPDETLESIINESNGNK